MRSRQWGCAVALSLGLVACAGSQAGEEGTTPDGAEVDPMDELKGIQAQLQSDMDALTEPIDRAGELPAKLNALTAELSIDPAKLTGMFSAKLSGTSVEVDLSADVAAEAAADAQAKVEALLTELDEIVASLKATPDKVTALGETAISAVAKVTTLGTKITTSAQVALSSPFAKAEAKAKAQVDIDGVAQIKGDIDAQIEQCKSMGTELPVKATEALASLTAAFSTP
jgi:hypothetical protein